MKAVVVATATNVLVASAWRDLLRSAGIDAELTGSNWESLFPMMSQLAAIGVLVPADDAERARGLIDEMEQAGAASRPGDGPTVDATVDYGTWAPGDDRDRRPGGNGGSPAT